MLNLCGGSYLKRQLTVNLESKEINTSYIENDDITSENDDLIFSTSLLSG